MTSLDRRGERRWPLWLAALAALLVAGGLVGWLWAWAPSAAEEPAAVRTPSSLPAPEATEPAPEPTPEHTEDPAPAADLGEPVRVVVPAIDVDAEVVAVGLLDDGAMEVPDFGLAGWYDLGPRPGEAGPAVIAAHVDSRDGPDVFFRLDELEEGDRIEVHDGEGRMAAFTVTGSELVDKDALPTDRIWDDTTDPVLRLITCGGEFDRDARSYRSNTIVYADADA